MKLKISTLIVAISTLGVAQQVTAANPASTDFVREYIQNLLSTTTLITKIGTLVPGGVVFYTDSTKVHGMIVADVDANYGNTTFPYLCTNPNNYLFTTTATKGGESNTAAMIAFSLTAQCQNAATQATQFAVNITNPSSTCQNSFSSDCLAGWTLPTGADLQLLMANLDVVNESLVAQGGTALSGTYWSSSQNPGSPNEAYQITATQGATPVSTGVTTTNAVRLVRYF